MVFEELCLHPNRFFLLADVFEVSLAYESTDLLPRGVSSKIFAQYEVSGFADATEKYSSRNLSSPINADLHFSLSRSGVLLVDGAEALIEISEWIEVPRANQTLDNSTISPNVSLEGSSNSTEESNGTLHSDGGMGTTSNSSGNDTTTAELGTEKKLKKRTFRVPLKIVEKTVGPGMPISKDSFAEANGKLEALDKKDA